MPATVVHSIGATGRDYSTLQTWEDAAPASLVVADQIWQGQCYNDAEFVGTGTMLTLSGSTSDATRYMELTTGPGQSFQDNAGVRTNALKYNQANGVAIRNTAYTGIIATDSNGYFRCSKLQLKTTGQTAIGIHGGGVHTTVKDLLCDSSGPGVPRMIHQVAAAANILVFVGDSNSSNQPISINAYGGSGSVVGCTVIRTSDVSAAGTSFLRSYGTVTMTDCASFGFTTVASGSWAAGSSNNATDQASGFPGTSTHYGITYNSTSPFTNATVASQNSIPVAGTALGANGVLDSTNAPNDITGMARPATPTIGCWELVGTGAPYVAQHRMTG